MSSFAEPTIIGRVLSFFESVRSTLKEGVPIIVACSGGPDSVALATALAAVREELPFRFVLAHVNHGLRGRASEADARFVAALAQQLRWPCVERRLSLGRLSRVSEEMLRDKRYAVLLSIARAKKASLILTAHTADDQVETVFLNFLRGSGPKGLAGMPPRRQLEPGIWLGRPFLEVSRKEIIDFLKKSGVSYRIDATNRNLGYTRNWLRHKLLPSVEKRARGFQKRILNTANLFREEELHWNTELDKIWSQFLREERDGWLLDFKGLLSYSAAAQRRFLRRVLDENLMSFERLEGLRRWMEGPPSAGRMWQLKKGWVVERLSKSKGSPSSSLFWFRKNIQKDLSLT